MNRLGFSLDRRCAAHTVAAGILSCSDTWRARSIRARCCTGNAAGSGTTPARSARRVDMRRGSEMSSDDYCAYRRDTICMALWPHSFIRFRGGPPVPLRNRPAALLPLCVSSGS